MPVHNADIAAIFAEMAELLELEGANPFRIRAYRNAVRTLSDLPRQARELAAEGFDFSELPGIGKDLSAKIEEILETGKCAAHERLRKTLPAGLSDLLHLPGLGPKRVSALYHELDIHTLTQLERAVRDGRVRNLAGFGKKTEERILAAIQARARGVKRFKLATAASYADALLAYLKQRDGVADVIVAGSFRRCKETVGDLDILATAKDGANVIDRFTRYDEVAEVVSAGTTRATVRLRSGLQVDLRVVPAESYGAALQYFTGSKAHNIAVRRLGQERGLKVNEYGVFKGRRRIAGETETSVYKSVGLPFIEPELRENTGEIEAARKGKLPRLVRLQDLRGDLHAHSKATDGKNTIREMAEVGKKCGFEYLAITEHSKRLTMTHGLDERALRRQMTEIDKVNRQLRGITILKGIEVDILEDGTLDLSDEVLSELDVVVAAVHGKFGLSRARQTERILRALDNPHVNILAHPTGRLIGGREPYDVDMRRVIREAKKAGCFLEVNAHPERLDLLDVYCRLAREEGVLIAVNSDAHSTLDFSNLRFGIGQARRGWLEKSDVLNTRPLREVRKLLRRR